LARTNRSAITIVAIGVVVALLATAVTAAADSATLNPRALADAQTIRVEITKRYGAPFGRGLVVTEATSTGVLESFTLLSADLVEARTVAAGNGIYYAICPRHAKCPYPARRFARPAGDLLSRRLALELALRTFRETSAAVVAVSLPTPRFIVFVVERDDLARELDVTTAAEVLESNPACTPSASLERIVDRVTRPRVFVPLGLEPTSSGGSSWAGRPRWPSASLPLGERITDSEGETR
jgi:hypothetical protein